LTGRQFDAGFSLPGAKMEMIFVLRDWLVRIERFIDVDE
jgi:hypothetical protein